MTRFLKRALFGLAVLALVLTIPVQHGETQAAGAVDPVYCESTIEWVGRSGGGGGCECAVSRCYDMQTHRLVSMSFYDCFCW